MTELAKIRVRDTVVTSILDPRLDGRSGHVLLELVDLAIAEGATSVVVDVGPRTIIDFSGARALAIASAKLGDAGNLRLSGLNARGRALLRSLRLADRIGVYEWWADAVETVAHAQAA